MSDQTQINVALFGTGGVAHMHAQGVMASTQARLTGAYSRNSANLSAFAQQYQIAEYANLNAILDDDDIDAVIIASPSSTHVPTAIACLEAGIHVLVEKPVGVSLAEVQNVKAVADRVGRICMPNHNYIYAPAIRRAKQAIDDGKLGNLSSMWMLYNQKHWPEMGTPGVTLWELCVHHVYSMLYLVGRPTRVTAVGTNVFFNDKEAADQISIQAELPNGVIVNLWGSFGVDDKTSNPWSVYYKVLGTEGGFSHSWNDLQFGEASQPGWDLASYRDSFIHSQSHFLNECIAAGQAPLSTLDDTLDAFCILSAAEQAMAERRWIDITYP
ncbi:MAG: Gfo/Idh/MocA family oxidoreductase [Motiliproteus sp.]